MGQARQLFEAGTAENAKRSDLLASLRRFHYSVHEEERREAIALLGSLGDSDAARELTQLYGDCEWRATRLAVIRALGRNGSQRAIEFLFRIARGEDIPLAETALWSLGQTHRPMAARFLTRFYLACREELRPAAAGAIGQIPDHSLAARLTADLEEALASRRTALVKNLVLTLGELRMAGAVPVLARIAADRSHELVSLAALVSLGKVCRNPLHVEPLEALYSRDPLEYQIFSGTVQQIRFRAQWTLEDYLQKLFEPVAIDHHLPLELNSFPAADVREGLTLFREERHEARLLAVLSRLDFPLALDWYAELVPIDQLPPSRLGAWIESLAAHCSPRAAPLLERVRPRIFGPDGAIREPALFARWIDTLSVALPAAPDVFASLVDGPGYASFQRPERIHVVNGLANFALAAQSDEGAVDKAGKVLARMLKAEKDQAVQGRIVRAFSQLGLRDEKIAIFVKDNVAKPDLTPSCLLFLETLPHRKAVAVLESALAAGAGPALHPAALLRALAAQDSLPDDTAAVDALAKTCLAAGADTELRVEALQLLARHPRPPLYEDVARCLAEKDERLQLAAVVALKSYAREDAAKLLAPFLASPNPSLAGRALDALTALRGLPAKVVAVDWLRDHPEDADLCDKLIRCLNAPEGEHGYFTRILDGILKKHPDHRQLDGLVNLRERLSAPGPAAGGKPAIPDKGLIDAALTKSVPSFARLDESVKSVLRSAELPFVHQELFEGSLDKASSILEFCKSLDLFLERHVGRKHLFPLLERSLHEFQNVLHAATLNEEAPAAERVLRHLGLEKAFTPESLPLHKMTVIAKGILTGRIADERFKVLDGLRAWAIVLLIFCRKAGTPPRAVAPLGKLGDAQIVSIAKRLMALQDIRNPAAHRQTFLEFAGVREVRDEVLRLLGELESAA